MKHVLVIEDDPFVAEIYREKLGSEGYAVAVASDGASGLEALRSRKPDLVLLDLMLPEVKGLDVLKAIRAQFDARTLPVLVITNAYLSPMVKQAWEAGANHVLAKGSLRPDKLPKIVEDALGSPPAATTNERTSGTPADLQVREKFLKAAPERLAALWRPLKALAAQPRELAHLHDLFMRVRPLSTAASLAGLDTAAQLAAALEALVKSVCDKPRHLTPSVLLTIAQAIDTLKFLFDHPSADARKLPSRGRVLVVDDDEFTRRSVSRALSRVNLKATCVANPVSALKRRAGKRFDLILLDVELPEATGFDLCTRFRAMSAHRETPIVFLSMHTGLEHRTESVLRGADDYVTKPFSYLELAVKSLCLIIRGRSGPGESEHGSNGHGTESVFSRRELSALKQTILGSFDG
ncbi:MAG TPA: response regulator [Verrucomicrobiae bacterium]|nr:response regulator [Verrucomicrobiae bacterium]